MSRPPRPVPPGWADAVAAYRVELATQGRASVTLDATQRWIRMFATEAMAQGAAAVAQVTTHHVSAFQTALWWQPNRWGSLYTAHTRTQALQMVRAFLRWAAATGRVAYDPGETLVLRKSPHLCSPLPTPEALARYFAWLDSVETPTGRRDALLARLFYHMSLLRAEVCALDRDDVDLAAGQLRIRGVRPRTVALEADLLAPLAAYLAEVWPGWVAAGESSLLLRHDGHRLRANTVSHRMLGAARRAGVAVTLQGLRRSGVARRLARGDGIDAVQALLGYRTRAAVQAWVDNSPPAPALPASSDPELTPSVSGSLPYYRRRRLPPC